MAQLSTTMLITLLITLWTSTLIRTLANITKKERAACKGMQAARFRDVSDSFYLISICRDVSTTGADSTFGISMVRMPSVMWAAILALSTLSGSVKACWYFE